MSLTADAVPRSTTKKPFGDISNTPSDITDNITTKPSIMEVDNCETTISGKEDIVFGMSGEGTLSPSPFDSFDHAVVREICNKVHHSTYSLEDLVDTIDTHLDLMVKNEKVLWKSDGITWKEVIIKDAEKRGGAVFYTILNDTETVNKVSGRDLRRKVTISETDIKTIVEKVGIRGEGKPWQIQDEYKKLYGIKDKLAPIFCTPKAKKNVSMTDRDQKVSSDEEETEQRRSGYCLPPTQRPTTVKAKKELERQMRQEAKQKEKEEKQKAKEREKAEKKAAKEREKASKPHGGAITKFVVDGASPSTASSPFMTPKKRSEKRFISAGTRLSDAWKKRDISEYLTSAQWAAKVLSGAQIDKIENELHRYSVRRVYNKVKDAQTLKKLHKSERAAFRERMHENRKQWYSRCEFRIKAHFSAKATVEDISLSLDSLPCVGQPVQVTPGNMELFSDCLMVTQWLSVLRKFHEYDTPVSALALCEAICTGGYLGFVKTTSQVICPIVGTLAQDDSYGKVITMNVRLRELSVESDTVSELCRALLKNDTQLEKSDKRKQKTEADGEQNQGDDDERPESPENEDDQEQEDLNVSQIEEDECIDLLSRFSADKELWQLEPQEQMAVMRTLLYRILDTDSFKDYISSEGLTDSARQLKDRITKISEQLDKWREEQAALPAVDDTLDLSTLSRTESKKIGDKLKKREALDKKIEDNQDKVEELVEKLHAEKEAQAMTKRITVVGRDRHFRNYYWFSQKSVDAGLWIQDLGVTAYERFVRAQIAAGKEFDSENEEQILRRRRKTANETPTTNGEHASTEESSTVETEPVQPVTIENSMTEASKEEAQTKKEDDDVTESPEDDGPQMQEETYVESWYHIENEETLQTLVGKLSTVGSREGALKKWLTKNFDAVINSMRKSSSKSNSREQSVSTVDDGASECSKKKEDEEEEADDEAAGSDHADDEAEISSDPLDGLKESIRSMASDLAEGYMTTLDPQTFEAKLISSSTLHNVKQCFAELVDSIPSKVIVERLSTKEAMANKCFSVFILDRWKTRLSSDARSVSAVHVLRTFLDSRIAWNKSVIDKRCCTCGSRRRPETKIACDTCGTVVHYNCTRPKLKEKPITWTCATCEREENREKEKKRLDTARENVNQRKQRRLVEDDDEDENSDSDDDEEVDEESDADDCFAKSSRSTRAARKRVLVDESDSDAEEEEEEDNVSRSRAKRTKLDKNPALEDCIEILDKVKSAKRLYSTLQNVPVPNRSSRSRIQNLTLEAIENGIGEYSSLASFAKDLDAFLSRAISYISEHNERKLSELEELYSSLNLSQYS